MARIYIGPKYHILTSVSNVSLFPIRSEQNRLMDPRRTVRRPDLEMMTILGLLLDGPFVLGPPLHMKSFRMCEYSNGVRGRNSMTVIE